MGSKLITLFILCPRRTHSLRTQVPSLQISMRPVCWIDFDLIHLIHLIHLSICGFLFSHPSSVPDDFCLSVGAGFRQRLLADPSFLFKVGIECGIGIFTKTTAEYKKRDDAFWHELDFVFANILMAILADFCLVWLPAPTMKFSGAAKAAQSGPKWMKNIPENAFQVCLQLLHW